jgi:hypothetical protein
MDWGLSHVLLDFVASGTEACCVGGECDGWHQLGCHMCRHGSHSRVWFMVQVLGLALAASRGLGIKPSSGIEPFLLGFLPLFNFLSSVQVSQIVSSSLFGCAVTLQEVPSFGSYNTLPFHRHRRLPRVLRTTQLADCLDFARP